ncbi:unnamed protein product [Cunninghamella blakesleeana]
MSSFEIPGVITPSQKTLIRSWWKKVTAAHPKAQNFKDMKVLSVDNGVFGIPLHISVKYASSSISYIDDHTGVQCYGVIPTVIAKCGSFLKEDGLNVEGIFRLPGNCRRLRILQTIFDSPGTYGADLDWRGYSVHDAASILRRFLNYLPEPLITTEFYQSFNDTIDQDFSSLDDKLDAFQKLIEKLPLPNQYLLLYLLDMLALFSSAVENTKMSSYCLACVFVPGILRHPSHEKNPAAYKHSQAVLQFLIEHQQSFNMPHQGIPTMTNSTAATTATTLHKKNSTHPPFLNHYSRLPPSPSPPPSTPSSHLTTTKTSLTPSSSPSPSPQLHPTPYIKINPSSTTNDCQANRSSVIYNLAQGSVSGTGFDHVILKDHHESEEEEGNDHLSTLCSTKMNPHDPTNENNKKNPHSVSKLIPHLKRSRTVPGKRVKYGDHEPHQVVYVNRTPSGKQK